MAAGCPPLAGACVYYQGGPLIFQTFCTDASGKAKVAGIPVGSYDAGVSGPDGLVWLNGGFSGLTVTEGHRADASMTHGTSPSSPLFESAPRPGPA